MQPTTIANSELRSVGLWVIGTVMIVLLLKSTAFTPDVDPWIALVRYLMAQSV